MLGEVEGSTLISALLCAGAAGWCVLVSCLMVEGRGEGDKGDVRPPNMVSEVMWVGGLVVSLGGMVRW